MDIYCQVTEQGLVPMYDSDAEEKNRLHVGERVLCRVSRPRNYEFLKKFWALIRLTYCNLPEHVERMLRITSEDDLLTCLKIELGLYTTVWHGNREVVSVGSISFAAMDETEFQRFYDRCIDIILGKYLRGTTRQEIQDNIASFK